MGSSGRGREELTASTSFLVAPFAAQGRLQPRPSYHTRNWGNPTYSSSSALLNTLSGITYHYLARKFHLSVVSSVVSNLGRFCYDHLTRRDLSIAPVKSSKSAQAVATGLACPLAAGHMSRHVCKSGCSHRR